MLATPTAVEPSGRPAEATAVTAGTKGFSGTIAFDNADNVYFTAHLSTTLTTFQLFSATSTGTRTDLTSIVPTRTADASVADVGPLAVTPDGSTLIFESDGPTLGFYDFYCTRPRRSRPCRPR